MNVFIIGLGSIAKKHITAILQIDSDAKIYALRRNVDCKNEIPNVTNVYDFNEVNMSEIDFILISNPTSEHFSTIKKVVQYGKPLFIEKPLFSEISEETEKLVEQLEKSNILTYVACNLRFLESLIKLKTLLAKERINEINVYAGSYLPNWRPDVDFRKVYSANKEMGGGVHIDLIHELDYIYWLFGKPLEKNAYFSNKSSLSISAFDYANYLWSYENFSVSIILNYYRKESKRSIEIVTEAGIYNVDLLKNSIDFDNFSIFTSSQKMIDTYLDQMIYFVQNILKKKKKFNTISEANTILKLCITA